MGNQYLTNPVVFLIETLFWLYILVVMLRFLLQLSRADFYNPFAQFLVKATQPVLRPLRRVIPGWGGIDFSALVLVILLQLAQLILVSALRGGVPPLDALFVYSLAELIALTLNIYLFAILVLAIMSFVNPGGYHPVMSMLYSLTEPVLRPARRVIPPMGALDLSPLVVLLGIQILKMLLLPPLNQLALSLY